MTNGEKIKEIFPNIIKYGNILIDDTGALQKNILFDDTWWNSEYKEPTTKNDLPHCQCTDAEIAKSFIEDVEAVKDQLPCGEQMDFPSTFDEFAKDYGFKDKDEVYTNGSELIPVFRVKQWLKHISTTKNDIRFNGVENELNRVENELEPITKNDLGVDLISRVDAINAVSEALKHIFVEHEDIANKIIGNLSSVTPQLSSELEKNSKKLEKNFGELDDCISRAEVMQVLQEHWLNGTVAHRIIAEIGNDIQHLPSVTPQEPRKGHWIDTKENSSNTRGQIIHEVVCSECNGIAYFRPTGNKYIGANTCPNCGAKMESEET